MGDPALKTENQLLIYFFDFIFFQKFVLL